MSEQSHDGSDEYTDEQSENKNKTKTCCCCLKGRRTDHIEGLDSWVCLVAVIFCNILIAIPETSFGIFYEYWQEKYGANKAAVGWIFFVFFTSSCLTGILVTPIMAHYGCRLVSITSMTVLSAGMCLCAVAPSVAWCVVFFGLMGGMGLGGLLLVSMTVIQQWFTYNRGLANGVAALGFTAGTILAPVIAEYLLTTYSLAGALLLHGALFVQGIVFAALLKTPDKYIEGKSGLTSSKALIADIDSELNDIPPHENNDTVPNKFTEEDSLLSEQQTTTVQLDSSGSIHVGSKTDESTCVHTSALEVNGARKQEHGQELSTDNDDADNNQSRCGKSTTGRFLLEMADFSLVKFPPFLIYAVASVFLTITRVGLLAHTVSAALHHGIAQRQAAHLFTILGLGNLVFRSIASLVINFRWVNALVYFTVGVVLIAASSVLLIFASTYNHFVISMALMGAHEGFSNTVIGLVVVYIVGVSKFSRAFSVLRIITLPASFVGSPFAAWLIDTTGDYVASYVMLAVSAILCVILCVIVYVLMRTKYGSKQTSGKTDETTTTTMPTTTKHSDTSTESSI